MASIINFDVYTNEDLARDFALKQDSETTPLDLTGADLRMKIVDEKNKDVALLRIGTSGKAYIAVPDPVTGEISLRVDRSVYANRAEQTLQYDILLVTQGTNERRLWGGSINVLRGITT